MKPFKNIKLSTLGVCAALLLSGCAKDGSEMLNPGKGGQEVVFSINIPGKSSSSTRAMTPEQESHVNTIEILLFQNGKVAANPAFTNAITSAPDGDGNFNKKSFSVNLPEGTFDIMIFANSLSAFSGVTIAKDDDQESTLAQLRAAMPTTGWVADGTSASLIPMWGIRENQVIAAGTMVTNIYLHRMLSRIDVSVTGADAATGNFKLKDIKLYNVQKTGRIAPKLTNWDLNGKVNEGSANEQLAGKATAPSLTVDGTYTVGISYQSFIAADKKSCAREMYIFEAAKATAHADQAAPYMTVLGEHNGVDGWYRIDLANYTDMSYLEVLRNHLYKIEIDKVDGTGYFNEEDAKKNVATNIIVNVTLWNEYDMGGTAFDGAHFVSITPQDIEYTKDAQANKKIVIKTDLGTTLTRANIKISDSPSNPDAGFAIEWIKNVTLGAPVVVDNRNVYELSYDVESNGLSPRAAYIYVTASSRLTNVVRVRQSDVVISAIDITDIANNDISILEFTAAKDVQPAMQQFKLRWSPTAVDVLFTKADIKNAFIFDGAFDVIPGSGTLNDPSGTLSYSIRPTAITSANIATDPFYERFSTVLYTITDGVKTATKALVLRQLVYNIVPKIEPVYLMDGTGKSFSVRSNSPFIVTLKTNPNNVVSGLTTTGVANTTAAGTPVNFTIIDDLTNPTLFQKDVVVTLKSPGGLFPDTDVTLNCASGIIQPKSNSYIVAPGGVGILIPVDRANESMLGNQLGVNEAFTANLVWTDHVNKIADNSNIKMLRAVGSGTGGYILVMPGSQSGNAVVAVKNSANKILWSWHIWVTGYNPAPIGTGKFMDRNLGAFSNTSTATVTDISAKGLLYQWGRKDPFPGSTTLSANTEPTLYTATGTTVVPKNNTVVANNFANTVRNPEMFYYSAIAPYDWYTSSSTQNNELWGPASKTVYDPCPDGWRVPQNGVWAALTTANFTWGNYGRTATNHGGFYPAAGYRLSSDGALYAAGAGGYYWSATVNGVTGYTLLFGISNVNPSYSSNRAFGFSVRCVQE